MAGFKDLFQAADWKAEKHVPVIEAVDKVKKGDLVKINITVGKEIPHPNTTEHHIAWAAVFFIPKAKNFLIRSLNLNLLRMEHRCRARIQARYSLPLRLFLVLKRISRG